MSLHDRLREARTAKGLTQKQLGEMIGVASNTIAGYESNREPSAAQLGALADALGVDVNFLLQDEFSSIKKDPSDYGEVTTLAAHHDGEDWTPEELEEIERFKAFVKSRRDQK